MFAVSSCAKPSEDQNLAPQLFRGETFDLDLNLAQDASVADNQITGIRVIVYNNQGKLVSNTLTQISQGSAPTVKAKVALGLNNFYIICNETEELTLQLEKNTPQHLIENITFQASTITSPLPMYGKVMQGLVQYDKDSHQIAVKVNGATTSALYVNVNRMLAKLNLTLIKNIVNADDDFIVENVKMTVCRMPRHTTIKEGLAYTSDQWANQITKISSNKLDNNGEFIFKNDTYTIPPGVDNIQFPSTYIAEHLLEMPIHSTNCTYLLIEATCRMKNGTSKQVSSTYSINIGENPPASYNIRRNNEYNIFATIKSLGAHGIYVEIVPMDMHDIPVNWKPIEGLVIVSDKLTDYDLTQDKSRNVNIWSDYSTYIGVLKVFHSATGYRDVVFKYGSTIALLNDQTATNELPYRAPISVNDQQDILWYPITYGNPYGKINSWGDVPFLPSGDVPSDNGRIAEGLGDPCKLVGLSETQIRDEGIVDNRQWRMATSADYQTLLAANDFAANNYGYKAFHYHLLPNAKSRNSAGVLSASKNGSGDYWTASNGEAFSFASQNPAAAAIAQHDPSSAFTVRCVRTSIAEGKLFCSEPSNMFPYQGNTIDGATVSVTSNIPYWTVTLIEDPSDPDVGTATDFEDFSFEAGATNVRKTSGQFNGAFKSYVKRKESTTPRTFHLRVKGLGYDGVTIERIVKITQVGYQIRGDIINTAPTMGIGEAEWIPKDGQTYTCSIQLIPTDVPIPLRKMHIAVYYLNTKLYQTIAIETTDPHKYTYDNITFVIPPNETPDVIGLNFYIRFEDQSSVIENIYSETFYQQNK